MRLRKAGESSIDSRAMGATMTENTGPNLGNRFQKGQSGNPAGYHKGSRHKATLLAERLMQDDAENIVNAVLTAARNGDMTAAKIILDRIAFVRRCFQCSAGKSDAFSNDRMYRQQSWS